MSDKVYELFTEEAMDTFMKSISDGKLNGQSTLREVSAFFKELDLEKRYELRKENATDWEYALKSMIKEIQAELKDDDTAYDAYDYILSGKNVSISEFYTRYIDNEYIPDEEDLKSVCIGVECAIFHPRLKEELKQLQNKEASDDVLTDEDLPDYEFNSRIQKIAWLHELGILEKVLDQCKNENVPNLAKAAKVIHSFTDIHPQTIRKCLEAVFQPNEKNTDNHPFNNPDNRLFVQDMRNKFKLNK